jgi:hypothetical protein
MYQRMPSESTLVGTYSVVGERSVVFLRKARRVRAPDSNDPDNRIDVARSFLVQKPTRGQTNEAGSGDASFARESI